MISFILKRLVQSVVVMLTVALIAFSMFRFVGDPINNMVGQDTSQADREALTERLGLNDPFIVQFGRFAANAAQGDFGYSYKYRQPVSQLILERMSATLELSFVSAILALVIGIPAGVYTALKKKGFLSRGIMTLSLVGVSLPTFLIGILLILLFGVILRWLPTFGRGDVVAIGWWTTGFLTASGLKSLILPAITLALFQMTLIPRPARSRRAFQACAEKYAGAGDHHYRAAARFPDRLRHHHRKRVSMAGHGPSVHSGDCRCGYSHHGRLSGADRLFLCHHQYDR